MGDSSIIVGHNNSETMNTVLQNYFSGFIHEECRNINVILATFICDKSLYVSGEPTFPC